MNVDTLMVLIFVFALIAATCTTAFPILYAFFPWRSSLLGKMLMLQAVAFALAMDGTVIFQIWEPSNIVIGFLIEVVVFGMIAFSTASLTVLMWKANHTNRKVKKENDGRNDRSAEAGPVAQREDV
jgi:hypothetical protein